MLGDSRFSFSMYKNVIYVVIIFYRKLREEIICAEQEVASSSEVYNKTKQDYSINKDAHSTKAREWRSAQSKIKRLEDDISMIRKEIHRLERFLL